MTSTTATSCAGARRSTCHQAPAEQSECVKPLSASSGMEPSTGAAALPPQASEDAVAGLSSATLRRPASSARSSTKWRQVASGCRTRTKRAPPPATLGDGGAPTAAASSGATVYSVTEAAEVICCHSGSPASGSRPSRAPPATMRPATVCESMRLKKKTRHTAAGAAKVTFHASPGAQPVLTNSPAGTRVAWLACRSMPKLAALLP